MGCKEDWEWEVATGIVKFPLALLITIIAIHGIYLTVKKKKGYKWISITTVIFFISSATFVLYATFQTLFICFGELPFGARALVIVGAFQNSVYGTHYCTLIIVLFTRVKVSFDGTSYQFSTCSAYCYKALSCCCFMLFMVTLFAVCVVPRRISFLFFASIFVFLFCSGLVYQSLFWLFVSKLKKVLQKSSDSGKSDKKLRKVMMKNVLLSSFSIIGTAFWLLMILIIAVDMRGAGAARFNLYGMAQNIDVFLNSLCIYLTMKGTARTYNRYCGRIHKKCSKTCCGITNDEKMIGTVIGLQATRSTSGDTVHSDSTVTNTGKSCPDFSPTDFSKTNTENTNV